MKAIVCLTSSRASDAVCCERPDFNVKVQKEMLPYIFKELVFSA